MTFFQDSK